MSDSSITWMKEIQEEVDKYVQDEYDGVERYRYDDMYFEIPWKIDDSEANMAVHRDETELPYPADAERLVEHHKEKIIKIAVMHRTGWEVSYSINSRAVVWKKSLGDIMIGEPTSETEDLSGGNS